MQVVVTVIFVGGACAFCIWSVLNLVGAIKERKAKKAKKESEIIEQGKEEKDK